jgi:hypothetical protein
MTARLIDHTKPSTFRSAMLRYAVAHLPCMRCNRIGATQAAHANQFKGMGIKASDALICALCFDCHAELDQGGVMNKEARRAFEFEMIAKTYAALMERGFLTVNEGTL